MFLVLATVSISDMLSGNAFGNIEKPEMSVEFYRQNQQIYLGSHIFMCTMIAWVFAVPIVDRWRDTKLCQIVE
jgi:hypothetical protein